MAEDPAIADAFDLHAGGLILYARQWVDPATAEDVVQRVFLKWIAGGRIPVDFRPWLFRCVRNEAITASRSAKRRDRREQSNAVTSMFAPATDSANDAAEAQKALSTLPPSLREVVTLRIWSQLTFGDIAEVTGMPLSTVHHHYKAALAELRQKLESSCKSR